MPEDDPFPSGFSNPGSTPSSLVAGVKALDADAWRRFAAVYGPVVYGWARRAGLGGEDAADVTQDVFRAVAAWADRLEHGRPGDTFRGWLWAVTRNKLRDHWRREAGAQAPGGSDALEQLLNVPAPDLSSVAGSAVRPSARLDRAVETVRAEFESRSWEAFWRVTVDGRPAAAVAAELGITANAVYVARSRILRRLRDVLSANTSD
jgi:RNA polymerase sigma-70 factor (ECF subfamily)